MCARASRSVKIRAAVLDGRDVVLRECEKKPAQPRRRYPGVSTAAECGSRAPGGLLTRVLQVLVNNAGITRDTLTMRMKPEQWQQVG